MLTRLLLAAPIVAWLILAALAAWTLYASPARSQNYPAPRNAEHHECEAIPCRFQIGQGGDFLEITAEGAGLLTLDYVNSFMQNSSFGHFTVRLPEPPVLIQYRILQGGSGMEALDVTPPEGWVAEPRQVRAVDGEGAVIVLRWSMF